MASYIADKTEMLASQAPVDPAKAQVAQIPLDSFTLPTFPPEAFTADLEHLCLTCDIPLSEYAGFLTKPFTIPELPSTITTLTLELFSLGYPTAFLSTLGQRLPGLKNLGIYSQILPGTTQESATDAVTFFKGLPSLRELHLVDVFCPKGFLTIISPILTTQISLKYLDVSFTSRPDDEFLGRVNADEIAGLIGPTVEGVMLRINPSVDDEEEGEEGKTEDEAKDEKDVQFVTGAAVSGVIEKLGKAARLTMMDFTMFELDVPAVDRIFDGNPTLKSIKVVIRGEWEGIFEDLAKKERELEILEIVGVGQEMDRDSLLYEKLLVGLSKKWKNLRRVKASFQKRRNEHWVKPSSGDWKPHQD